MSVPPQSETAAQQQITSLFTTLFEPFLSTATNASISPSVAAQRTLSYATDYIEQISAQKSAANAAVVPARDARDDGSTPGLQDFFWMLWSTVLEAALSKPDASQTLDERMALIISYVSKVKETPQPAGQEWFLQKRKTEFRELPVLGWCIRDLYNAPLETAATNPALLQPPENQAVVAGAIPEGTQSLNVVASSLATERRRWLALQEFISRLWRDCQCDDYALYALWALRDALEDWPTTPPSFDTTPSSCEESSAYRALLVEAAAIWIRNTAPLMYANTQVWGKNGNPEWPDNAGAPGRGGNRWEGVDGYDIEHKRWNLWKQILQEVVQWCDTETAKGHIKGWRVKEEASKALEAMAASEGLEFVSSAEQRLQR